MLPSPRSCRAWVLAALGVGAAGCAASPFALVYCEDGAANVRHCDCEPAAREVLGGRVGGVDVREYGPGGAPLRAYREGRELQFVVQDRWLVIRVNSFSARPASLQAWLDCGEAAIPGEVVRRAVFRDPSGVHEHEFLALFSGGAGRGASETPVCRMYVALAGTGWRLTRASEPVYFVERVREAGPVAGLTWGVPITDESAPMPSERDVRLAPRPSPPPPRLCRSAAE